MGEPSNCIVLRSEIFSPRVFSVVTLAVFFKVVYCSTMTTARITPTTDGPYEVDGEATIVAPDGTVIKETTKTYLCRCGASKSKPFCDGSHKRINWSEES
jgi:hypothetical protein